MHQVQRKSVDAIAHEVIRGDWAMVMNESRNSLPQDMIIPLCKKE